MMPPEVALMYVVRFLNHFMDNGLDYRFGHVRAFWESPDRLRYSRLFALNARQKRRVFRCESASMPVADPLFLTISLRMPIIATLYRW
jgi:hypothetical protein